MARDLTSNSCCHDQRFQGYCTCFALESLIEELEDGNIGRGVDDGVEIIEAEEHGH